MKWCRKVPPITEREPCEVGTVCAQNSDLLASGRSPRAVLNKCHFHPLRRADKMSLFFFFMKGQCAFLTIKSHCLLKLAPQRAVDACKKSWLHLACRRGLVSQLHGQTMVGQGQAAEGSWGSARQCPQQV